VMKTTCMLDVAKRESCKVLESSFCRMIPYSATTHHLKQIPTQKDIDTEMSLKWWSSRESCLCHNPTGESTQHKGGLNCFYNPTLATDWNAERICRRFFLLAPASDVRSHRGDFNLGIDLFILWIFCSCHLTRVKLMMRIRRLATPMSNQSVLNSFHAKD
jgi:hypothetical protein